MHGKVNLWECVFVIFGWESERGICGHWLGKENALIYTLLGSCPKNASRICSKVGHAFLVEEKLAPHDIICTQHVRTTLLIPISEGGSTLNSVFCVTYYLALHNAISYLSMYFFLSSKDVIDLKCPNNHYDLCCQKMIYTLTSYSVV